MKTSSKKENNRLIKRDQYKKNQTERLLTNFLQMILKRRSGLSTMASRVTRAFDPMRDYGLFSKLRASFSPESNLALDRESEVAWQIEKYLYLGTVAIGFIFMVERVYSYELAPFDDGFPWKWLFMIFCATIIALRYGYMFFRHREISSLSWSERKEKIKELVVSGVKRSVFTFVSLIIVIIFSTIDASLSTAGQDQPPFQFSLLILIGFTLLLEVLWIVDLIWLKKPPVKKEKASIIIEDVFLVDTSGNLMTHHARRLVPDMDDDIMMGMFTAIQDFMGETFRSQGTGEGHLNTLHYGDFKILIEHGEFAYMAMVMKGEETPELRKALKETIAKIHRKYSSVMEDWSGSPEDIEGAKGDIKKLINDQVG